MGSIYVPPGEASLLTPILGAILSVVKARDALPKEDTIFNVFTTQLVEGESGRFCIVSVLGKFLYQVTEVMEKALQAEPGWDTALMAAYADQKRIHCKYNKVGISSLRNSILPRVQESNACYIFKGIYGKNRAPTSPGPLTDLQGVLYEVDVVGRHTYWELSIWDMCDLFGEQFTKIIVINFEMACNFGEYSPTLVAADLQEFFSLHPKEHLANWFKHKQDVLIAIEVVIAKWQTRKNVCIIIVLLFIFYTILQKTNTRKHKRSSCK